ncbi:MAG: hypothetical protein AABP62_26355 [Planctomycetota bacterium]
MTDIDPESPAASTSAASTSAALDHAVTSIALSVNQPSFQPPLQWRESGDLLRAQQGFDKLAQTIARRSGEHEFGQEALWLEATRLWFETTLESDQSDLALSDIRRRFERFNQPAWAELKQSTARFYHDMIHLSIATGLDEQAFDLYQKARDTVAVPPELRVKLLEIAHRLDRFDPATARLCIEALTTGPSADDAQTERLFEILRRAIRVTPDQPAPELLAEFRALNLQTWETAQRGWAVGHLAMADWRLGQLADADRWCHQCRQRHQEDPSETNLLIGTVSYLRHEWKLARDQFQRALGKDTPELHPIAMALSQLEELNDRLEQRGSGQTLEEFHRTIHQVLAGLRECERNDGWRLDTDWVMASAMAALGETEAALARFRQAPATLARWRHVATGWEILRVHLPAEEVDEWTRRLAADQPAVAQCLDVLRETAAFRFEEARRALAVVSSVHAEAVRNNQELQEVVSCLTTELALAQVDATPTVTETGLPAFQEWRDRLELRRLIERGDVENAGKLAERTTQHTAPPPYRERLQAVVAAVGHRSPEQADELFDKLVQNPSAEPLDRLHAALWQSYRGHHEEAEPHLRMFANLFPSCIECQLALIACALNLGRADEAREQLSQVSSLTNWRNQFRWAWFRPWQRLIPSQPSVDQALVASPRLADVLHAADLALQALHPELAAATLEHFQTLLGPHVPAFALDIGARFNRAAAIEAQRGNWEQACRFHQTALVHGNRDVQFVEAVATTYASATTAPDHVLEVLFAWLMEFPGKEIPFLATVPGGVFANLVRIESPVEPESERELAHRRRWTERFHQVRPDWDEPKRSLLRVQVRIKDDAAVIAVGESIREKRVADHRLLARALWNRGCFQEAATAFAAGEEPGWAGIVAAAKLFQSHCDEGHWLSEDVAKDLLSKLAETSEDLEHLPQWRLWTGAVLVASRRGADAVPYLESAVNDEMDADRRILLGLALLLAGEVERAEELWGSPQSLSSLVAMPEQLINWNRTEALLWMLVRLQRPGDHELPLLGKLTKEWRKLGETGVVFQTVVAELAFRIGDMAAAQEAVDALSQVEPRSTREILRSPVQCFLRDEREFVRCRMLMHKGQFELAERELSSDPACVIGETRRRYWQALSLIHMGDKPRGEMLLAELQDRCPTDPAIPAQRAQLRLADGDLVAAEGLCQSALTIDPTHAFAMFVNAELAERQGDIDGAMDTFRKILTLPNWQVHRRLRAAVAMALGRLMLTRSEARQALEFFRLARKSMPQDPLVVQRMGIVLAACAETEDEFQEAETLLATAASPNGHDLVVALARVITADHLNNTPAVSERLEVVLDHPQFTHLPAAIQREWVVFSVDTQLRQQCYRAAADALEQLLRDSPDEDIAERLRRCRLLEALQVLGRRPLPPDAFEQIRNAATTVCAGPQPPPIAVLLKAMGQLFTGQCETPEACAATRAELQASSHDNHETAWLTTIVRFWLGDELVKDELGTLWKQPETQSLRRVVETIAASQQQKAAPLADEARRLVAAPEIDGTVAFDLEDLIVVAALADGASKLERAEALLTQWHALRRGTDRTRLLLSKLLAKHAVKSLKQKKFGQTRQLLHDALAAAEG